MSLQCEEHPEQSQGCRVCKLCSAQGLPCGPYETAEETFNYLRTLPSRKPLSGELDFDLFDDVLYGDNIDHSQPSSFSPALQNAASQNPAFAVQNTALGNTPRNYGLSAIPSGPQDTARNRALYHQPSVAEVTETTFASQEFGPGISETPMDPYMPYTATVTAGLSSCNPGDHRSPEVLSP